ncbi:DHA2 family efflux MFS transporter permease subunit [Corallococcus praedator]|uniref:DHA2 family efflux MFS transporter permease subunit n=1 Tax=Corallococcus praedator TaxID=2316724 RepID=A0ABX9QNU2_9BACT|nr:MULTISPECIES: DHA2 family efflux MFS transporter permease subunit [Corallococcus]RKH33713.1 DHA2 family efflux MFS transporter permease subunit [Corallococcus sp. CA031C]RKI14913.1 DHA2 family efflux MFS transporter permease subunit [Corallococcus praedator]
MATSVASPGALAATPKALPNKWLVTLSVTFGTLMGAIDSSIVNVALPQIRGAVGATVQEITWATTGFVIATVMVMPLTGFLGRLFGQKRVYLACLVLFVVGSFLCGFAWNLPTLVLFRFLQGLGAGALQPTEQAILRQTFPPKEQGTAMAVFAMAVMVGPAIGPTLGGYIVDNFHWSWIFFINVPVGILGFFMVARFVQEDEQLRATARVEAERQRKHMDWAGITLLCMGLASLQYFLEEGQADDWFQSPLIIACALFAATCLIAFVICELTAEAPAVNLRLFKDPVFASGTMLSALVFAVLMASMFLLPVFMQELLGFTATQSGFALMPRTLVMLVMMPIVGRLYGKVPARVLVAAGIVFAGFGAFEMSHFSLATGSGNIISAIALQGVGFSLMFVPLSATALANIPRERMADATGLNSLLRQIGGSMGLAIFTTLLSRYTVTAKASIAAHLNPERWEVAGRMAATQQGLMQHGLDAAGAKAASLQMMVGSVSRQAMVLAFDKLFVLAALMFVVVLPLIYFLKAAPSGGGSHEKPHIDVEI